MLYKLDNAALVIIDVQKAFNHEKWGKRNNFEAEQNIESLLKLWRKKKDPVIHIQHLSDNIHSIMHPSHEGSEFKDSVKPIEGEVVIQKKVNSAFIGTNLEEYLRANGIEKVVIVGLTTPHCVSTTTRMSGNLGFDTYLISDATAAFGMKGPNDIYYNAEEIHAISLATLHEEFATILTTKEMMGIMGIGILK
ncbi:cysteine hydrolase family protein [Bacillus sp. 123MFChir2]|uniref:cysteine hydrolase family protein n=1 Tax=Bacillus sp. 123MFChir2 TaxID=1169144 RepID=UPI000379AEE2|nr:cysteine hydrolase family protein [Bacillus sp. 123MFChir2]